MITFKDYIAGTGFNRINNGKYQSKKYYIFNGNKGWWYLYSRSDYAIAQYDVYCGMFKTCKDAIRASEELDRLDKKANKLNVFKNSDIRSMIYDREIKSELATVDTIKFENVLKIKDKLKNGMRKKDWMKS